TSCGSITASSRSNSSGNTKDTKDGEGYEGAELRGAAGHDVTDTRGELARGLARDPGGLDRIVDDQRHPPGTDGHFPPEHHVTAADEGDRHDGQPCLKRDHEGASFEPRDRSVGAARAFGK